MPAPSLEVLLDIMGKDFNGLELKSGCMSGDYFLYKQGYDQLLDRKATKNLEQNLPGSSHRTTWYRPLNQLIEQRSFGWFSDPLGNELENAQRLLKLEDTLFNYLQFEEIVGFYVNCHNIGGEIFHRSLPGVSLERLANTNLSEQVESTITELFAKALREAHDRRIYFHDPQPYNFKYDSVQNKIISSPTECMRFGSRSSMEEHEVAIAADTNPLISKNLKHFVQTYLQDSDPHQIDRYLAETRELMQNPDSLYEF
jgi:hypothetical protein